MYVTNWWFVAPKAVLSEETSKVLQRKRFQNEIQIKKKKEEKKSPSFLARQFFSTFSCGSKKKNKTKQNKTKTKKKKKKDVLNLQNGFRWFKELNRFFIEYKWFGITFLGLVWFCISFVMGVGGFLWHPWGSFWEFSWEDNFSTIF